MQWYYYGLYQTGATVVPPVDSLVWSLEHQLCEGFSLKLHTEHMHESLFQSSLTNEHNFSRVSRQTVRWLDTLTHRQFVLKTTCTY